MQDDHCNSYVRSLNGIIKALLVVLNILLFSIAFAKDHQTDQQTPIMIASTTFASSLGSVFSVVFLVGHASGVIGMNGCGAILELNYNVLWSILYCHGTAVSIVSFDFSEPENFFWRAIPMLEMTTAVLYVLETIITGLGFKIPISAGATSMRSDASMNINPDRSMMNPLVAAHSIDNFTGKSLKSGKSQATLAAPPI